MSNNEQLLAIRMDAVRFPRLHTYSREDAVTALKAIAINASMYRGSKMADEDAQYIGENLYNEMMSKDSCGMQYLSLDEIALVVKRAVLGGAEMYGINVASLYKVLLDYVKGEGHRLNKEALTKATTTKMLNPVTTMLESFAGALVASTQNNQ